MDVPQLKRNQQLQLYSGAITLLSVSNIHQEDPLKNVEFVPEFILLPRKNLTPHFERLLVFV
jgi:hypothetical protein